MVFRRYDCWASSINLASSEGVVVYPFFSLLATMFSQGKCTRMLITTSAVRGGIQTVVRREEVHVYIACSAIYTALCLLYLLLFSCHLRLGEMMLGR